MRLTLSLLALVVLSACNQPVPMASGQVAPPPPLLPVEEILAADSPQLSAEAAAALAARGDALRGRAGVTR